MEHLGRKGVIVPRAVKEIVKQRVGSAETVTEELRTEVVRTYSWHELESAEKVNFEDAVEMIKEANPLGANALFETIDIVDFRSDDLMGQFKDGRYLVAKKLLSNRDETLATLVHEVAHEEGGDGEKGHVAALESIWSNIVGKLRDLVDEVA